MKSTATVPMNPYGSPTVPGTVKPSNGKALTVYICMVLYISPYLYLLTQYCLAFRVGITGGKRTVGQKRQQSLELQGSYGSFFMGNHSRTVEIHRGTVAHRHYPSHALIYRKKE